MTSARCPCCGAPIAETAELAWNARERVLTGRGHGVVFGPVRGEIFDLLWRARSRHALSTTEIADVIYAHDPDGGPDSASRSIAVLIHLLGIDLAPFKLAIVSTRGRGAAYRLVLTPDPCRGQA